jgi:hypothetical protein
MIIETIDCGVTACTDCIDLNLWNHNDTGVAKTEDGLDLSWGEMMSLTPCSPCNFAFMTSRVLCTTCITIESINHH